ncbi:antibiotic biosynthesis monooxygenase [Paenibacillus sp. HWE-109]|uniref:putative quinol monooxygenase n=1 Tax=Paenibacillus sp. HWE-109 TaxID=1306526 RepID=UPI001EDD0EF6|nr:putative quinol monooxygenase [Paenibacillus sp. HWE-109]UKS29687.1 antibiotic biosynthesis monooxygenase [Paenibacillus sp. HWE-109]
MIILHANLQVNPARNDDFLREVKALVAASRVEDGNIAYNLYLDIEKECTYTMVEIWENLDAVASHNKSDHLKTFVSRAREFLAAPLIIKSYKGEPLETPTL